MSNSPPDLLADIRDRVLHLELDVKLINHIIRDHSLTSYSQYSSPTNISEPKTTPVSAPSKPKDDPVSKPAESKPEKKQAEPIIVEDSSFGGTILKSLSKNISMAMGAVVLSLGTVITGWIQGISYKPPDAPKEVTSQSQQTNQPRK